MFGYPFWQRYLSVFDELKIVSRVLDVEQVEPDWKPANGDGVLFHAIPYYHGFSAYFKNRRAIQATIRAAFSPDSAVICRVPSVSGSSLIPLLQEKKHPYGVEVVGDPWDVFSPGASKHPLRPLFRRVFTNRLKAQCQNACACAYVTREALQRRYPPAQDAFKTHYSSIELKPEAFASEPKVAEQTPGRRRVICVGTLDQLYKAPDVLIDAIAKCVQQGTDAELAWGGDGLHRAELQQRADALGLGGRMIFLGQLAAGQAVRHELAKADLFVLPSRQEGLPRAMIEAMAAGLPCLGSNVGGIPELLDDEHTVNPNDADTLAQKITRMLSAPDQMTACAQRNLILAQDYRDEVLNERRKAYYQAIAQATASKR